MLLFIERATFPNGVEFLLTILRTLEAKVENETSVFISTICFFQLTTIEHKLTDTRREPETYCIQF